MLDYHIGEIVVGADYTSMLTKPRCYCHGGIPSSRGNPGFIARKIYRPPDVVYFFSRWKYQYIAIFNSQPRLVFNVCSFLLTFLATMNATISHPSPLLTVADCRTLVSEKNPRRKGRWNSKMQSGDILIYIYCEMIKRGRCSEGRQTLILLFVMQAALCRSLLISLLHTFLCHFVVFFQFFHSILFLDALFSKNKIGKTA